MLTFNSYMPRLFEYKSFFTFACICFLKLGLLKSDMTRVLVISTPSTKFDVVKNRTFSILPYKIYDIWNFDSVVRFEKRRRILKDGKCPSEWQKGFKKQEEEILIIIRDTRIKFNPTLNTKKINHRY